jgi:uncharacterized protein with ParB-like and HNH nuclease domain
MGGGDEARDGSLEVEIEDDDEDIYVEYDIASYPSDLTLSVIHEMWNADEISIPSFQRNYVWNIKQASLLIESFLLGLPVPQVFFYIDSENKNLVIDGQQRITSVVFFFEGYFGSENLQGRRQVFKLSGLSKKSPYYNKKYEDLTTVEQRKLKGAVLRAVNIKQLSPANQSTSMFHIFERLNTGGTPLRAQEIRNCVFHGGLVTALQDLNADKDWRKILGRKSLDKHQRDVEMILRVFAMSDRGHEYEKPMKEFLNSQMGRYRRGQSAEISAFQQAFRVVASAVKSQLPEKPFHVRGPINLAAMDSVLSTLVRFWKKIPKDLDARYQRLLNDEAYKAAIFFNTSDASVVKFRLDLAEKYLVK